jgi:tRNA A-37 threonylcarbamoyl transferase component Bud32
MDDAPYIDQRSGTGAGVAAYEILGRVATTATGAVWKARDAALDRFVALKEVASGSAVAEASALASLTSEHVVRVFGVVDGGPRSFLVEEWVDGATLTAVLRSAGQLAPEQALAVVRGALLGLADAHRSGLVHGDVSMSNILVDATGTAKLIDFGSFTRIGLTARAATGAFAAPEVRARGQVTPATDVFAAAAVLAMLLHGRADREPTTSGIDEPIRSVLDKALAPNPADRYPDAAAFLAALEDAAQRRYGTAWWTQAGLGGLATASAGALIGVDTLAPFVAGQGQVAPVAQYAAAQGVAQGPPPSQVLAVGARRTSRKAWWIGGGVAAAVLTVAGIAVAVSTSGDNKTPEANGPTIGNTSSIPTISSASTSSAPPGPLTGTYSAKFTVTSTTGVLPSDPEAKVGFTRTRTWQVVMTCNLPACTAKVSSSSGSKFTFQVEGPLWLLSQSPIGSCRDIHTGKLVSKTQHHVVIALRASPATQGTLPSTLTGTSTETADRVSSCPALKIVQAVTVTRTS